MADASIRAVITAEDRASSVLEGFSSKLSALGEVAGGVFALDKVVEWGKEFVNAFSESEVSAAQLNAVLKSTNGVAGVTAQAATELSESLAKVTTYSHETVLGAENMLLTFTNIGKSIFPEATKAALDMSTALGQDTKDSAIQLGKALQDPILGVTALRRVGVAFNETQRQTITNLVNSGQALTAQKMILKELETEFGGSAEAIGQTFGGQLQILKNDLQDTEQSMGQVISGAIGPFIDSITKFVSTNGHLITSIGLATLVAGGFAAAVIAVAGAIAIAWAAMGPLTLGLLAISALLGGVVFETVQNFQKQMGATADAVSEGSKQMATDGANNFGATGQAADDLTKKLADIQTQMDQTAQDFMQSLATIVQTHEQAVQTLKGQIDDENKAFADAELTKQQTFQRSNDTQVSDHAAKTRDIESQIKALQITNTKADEQRINDLRVSLAQENEAYAKKNAEAEAQYQTDTANAATQHQAKLTDYQTKLDAETTFLKKHQDDITAIQHVAILDEIERLKQSNARQMKSFEDAKNAAIQSASQTISGIGGLNTAPISNLGTTMGGNMASAFGAKFKDSLGQVFQSLGDQVGGVFKGFDPLKGPEMLLKAVASSFRISALPHFATGGVVAGPIGSPTLAVVHGGERIVPTGGMGSGSNSTINITLNSQNFMGSQVEARKFAQTIVDNINDIAGKKNMTGAQMLGAN